MKKCVFFLSMLFLSMPLWAQLQEDYETIGDTAQVVLPWPENVQSQLDSLVKSPLMETTQLGLMVWDLDADSALYCYNHRQTLRPASTMKLVTAITALDRLGGNYQLSTSFYYRGEIPEDSIFRGELYVVGGMDPRFDMDDLFSVGVKLHDLGIDTLRCSIVTDCSMKDTLHWGEGWCWDDKNPELSPLLVGKKTNFTDRMLEALVQVGVIPDSISLTTGTVPEDAHLLAIRTHTIDNVLLHMMKQSDNLYAEAMYYQLAASGGQRGASAEHARKYIRQLVSRLGLNTSAYRFADGSGLSLYNYVSAELETRLLRYAWQNSSIRSHLVPSLPIAGVDGTLKERMRGTSAEGNVTAKTGTLTGISSLAGYCKAYNGHQLAFCIINQGVLRGRDGRAFQDEVCKALTREWVTEEE